MFAVPAVARAQDLIRLAGSWQPDAVIQELYELGGTYVEPAAGVRALHGLGAHYPNFRQLATIAGAEVARRIGGPNPMDRLVDKPYIDPFPTVLQPPDDRPFPNVWPIRPEIGEVGTGDRLPPTFEHLAYERTVYFTLGTFFNTIEAFGPPVEALSALPVNVVVTCGPDIDPADFGPLPANVAVARYVPQALVLPRCVAVVSHAGAGTLIGGLSQGLPQVCLPRGADQYTNAAQVARAGAGITLMPGEAEPKAIRRAVETVLADDRYRQAAQAVQAEIAALPTPAEVLVTLTAAGASDTVERSLSPHPAGHED
jgi:UDP:flavonoid glycosyltransferase YjiC (YdhE family)